MLRWLFRNVNFALHLRSAPGKVYIECSSVQDVNKLCHGMNFVLGNRAPLMVNQEEQLAVRENALKTHFTTFKKCMYVTVRTGLYRGDLGIVYDVDKERRLAKVLVVPRMKTYVSKKDRQDLKRKRRAEGRSATSGARRSRPPARQLSPKIIIDKRKVDKDGKHGFVVEFAEWYGPGEDAQFDEDEMVIRHRGRNFTADGQQIVVLRYSSVMEYTPSVEEAVFLLGDGTE